MYLAPDNAAVTVRGRASTVARVRVRARHAALLLLPFWLLFLGLEAAGQADEPAPAPTIAPEYRLTGFVPVTVPEQSSAEFFYRLPSSFTFDSLNGLNPDALGGPLDHARATVRYTWLSHPSWAMKVGLSTTLEPETSWQRLLLAATDHPHVSPIPSMHLSGESQLSDRWMLSLDAEGQRWSRGQSLDMDLRINYHLTPDLALYGSYRLTDNFGESGEYLGFPISNSARFGVRLRF